MLGIAGLVGSGRTELARLIYGADPQGRRRGHPRRAARLRSAQPADALATGIAYLTEDRKALGLFLDLSCEHQHQSRRDRPRRAKRRHRSTSRAGKRRAAQRLRGACASARRARRSPSAASPAATSRRCCCRAGSRPARSVLILDEPTRGVDIGAKSEIYRIIDELAQQRHRRHRHLERAAGDHRRLRPRAGHARGPHRRRGRRPRSCADHAGEHHGATAPASARKRPEREGRMAMEQVGRSAPAAPTPRRRRRAVGAAGADAQHACRRSACCRC